MNSFGWQLGIDQLYHIFRQCPLLRGHQYDNYKGHKIILTMKILGCLSLCKMCERKENTNNFFGGLDAV